MSEDTRKYSSGGYGGGSGGYRGDRDGRDRDSREGGRDRDYNSSDDGKPRRKKRRMSFRKRRPPADLKFDYKKITDLLPFLTEEGKIIPARVSGLRAHQQRQLTLAIKRARNVALISPIRRVGVDNTY